MTTVLEEFVGKLGWQVDKSGPAEFKKQSSGIVAGIAKIGAAYTAVAGLITGFVAKTNAQTAATYRLAQSLGVSYDWLDRWGDTTKGVGIGVDGVRTAMGFLNKTLGAVRLGKTGAEAKTFGKTLDAIGLRFDDIVNASPELAFNKVAFAIGNTGDRTIAATAAAKLFGRGAGMSFARLGELAKANGQTVEEYLNRFRDLEFETEQSAKGAKDFTASWAAIAFAIDETKRAFAGLIGEALTPMLKDIRLWIANNKELIKQKIVEWSKGVAKWLKEVWTFLSKIAGLIGTVIAKVGGLGTVLKLIVFFYLGSKFVSATRNVTNLGGAFGSLAGKAEIAAAKTGLLKTGLLAIAALSIDDLLSSLDDISNESWGNKIARKLLKWSDELGVYIAENLFGKHFADNADRATWLAKVNKQIFEEVYIKNLERIANLIQWIQNHIPSFHDIWSTLSGGGAGSGVNVLPGARPRGEGSRVVLPAKPGAPFVTQSAYAGAGNWAPGAQNFQTNVTINQSPGMSATAVADTVTKTIEKQMKRAVKNAQAAGSAR